MTAIAEQAVSGVTSAYISEAAEKRRERERAMIADFGESAYGHATRLLPLVIAVVNGSAPLVISLLIIAPMWAGEASWPLPAEALTTALAVIFLLLGVYLGRISGAFWL